MSSSSAGIPIKPEGAISLWVFSSQGSRKVKCAHVKCEKGLACTLVNIIFNNLWDISMSSSRTI